MTFIGRAILHIIANGIAIIIANRIIPGFVFYGSWTDLLLAGAILGIVNSFIRPVVKFLSLPIIFLTLGLFSLIINIAMIFLVDGLVSSIQVDGFWSGVGTVIIVSIVNSLIFSIAKKEEKND